jgi:uncharacterized protein YqgV (UPF0045/DUF77 family)
MAIIEVSVVPLGTATPSVSRYVAHDLDNLLDLVKMMHRSVLDLPEIMRVVTTVKIDERQDKSASIAGKVAAVKKELAE